MRRNAMLIGGLLVMAAPVQGQVGSVSPEAMRKLDFLIGDWSGEAWYAMGPEGRTESRGTEQVRMKAGGAALMVEGRFSTVGPDGEERVVHDALGIIAPDPAGGYRIRSFLADGRQGESKLELTEEGFRWELEIPGQGVTRYTMRLTPAGEWVETGEFSRDGGRTWMEFMEMRLVRDEPVSRGIQSEGRPRRAGALQMR